MDEISFSINQLIYRRDSVQWFLSKTMEVPELSHGPKGNEHSFDPIQAIFYSKTTKLSYRFNITSSIHLFLRIIGFIVTSRPKKIEWDLSFPNE